MQSKALIYSNINNDEEKLKNYQIKSVQMFRYAYELKNLNLFWVPTVTLSHGDTLPNVLGPYDFGRLINIASIR